MAPTVSTIQAYILMFGVIVLWGANWPIMKIGLEVISPLWFAAARALMGAVLLFALLRILGRLTLPQRQDLPIVISVGVLQVAGFMGLAHLGLQYVDPGRSSILAYTTPLWVTPLALLILKERLSGLKIVGLIIGLMGLIALFNPFADHETTADALLGDAMLILAAVSWAFAIIHIRGHRWHGDTLLLVPWQMLFATPILAVLAFIFEGPLNPNWSAPELWWVLAYNGPLASAFCFWAWVTANKALPAVTTALASMGVPVMGLLSSAIVLGEALGLEKVLGLSLIITGVVISAISDIWKSRRPKVDSSR